MLFLHVESANARSAELRRAAELARRHRAPRDAHHAPAPKPPGRARRSLRTTAVAAVTRVAR
jgi:hypothetical protein